MEKTAFNRDSSSFCLRFLMDFLSLHTISNWVYFRIGKFISGSVSSQRSFSERNCIREEREDEKLTEEELKTLLQNLGISSSCSREEDHEEKPLDSDDVVMAFDEKEPSFEEIKEAFDVFDRNRDGFIDPTELQRILCVLGSKDVGSSLERCKEMIKCFDLNNDGRIDFNEFVKLMETSFCS